MDTDGLFGWNLTFKTVERDIRQKSDILIAFIHWNLTKRGFRTIGIGEERTFTGEEEKSEILPTGWNDKDNYVIRYVLNNKLYIMHGVTAQGNLIVNLLRTEDLAVSNIALTIDTTVEQMSGDISKMIPTYKDLIFHLKRDLIDIVTEKPTTTAETQTSTVQSNPRGSFNDPLRIRPRPNAQPDNPNLWDQPSIGRSDLDPFAPSGGGMLFNPFGPRSGPENPGLGIPGGLPRGAVPPGARFDPFGPPMPPGSGRRRYPPPDADHLPPPGGFDDNMFM